MMTTVTDITSLLAAVCTIALFISSIPTCLKIIRKESVADVNFFPFIAMFCNAALWVKYGTLKGDTTLVLVNGVGTFINLIYISVYYIYAGHKLAVFRQILLGGLVIFPILIYVQFYALDRDLGISRLGQMCCTLGVVAYGAPLSAMAKVIRTKSTATMILPLSFANFVVSSEWTAYGYLVSDFNIIVPNGLGMLLGLLQLLLFIKYPSNRSQRQESTRKGTQVL